MAVLVLLSGALLMANAPSASDEWQKCVNSTVTNPDWASCGIDYLKRLDGELNVVWKKAYAALGDPQSRAQMLEEQRAWLKFRDASCQFWANGQFGREGQVFHFAACRGAIIEARITGLKDMTIDIAGH